MSPEAVEAFLGAPRIANLATLRADGSPTMVPVWFEWDGRVARVLTGRESPKVHRIARDPRVALTVAQLPGETEAWVTIEGTATLARDGTDELIARITPRYWPPEKASAAIKAWLAQGDFWVTLTIQPTQIRSLTSG